MNTKDAEKLIKEKGFIDVSPNDIDLISNIQKSGKYILDLTPDINRKWIVRKNPNHHNWFFRELIAGIIGAVLALAVGILLWQIDKQQRNQEIQQLNNRLEKVESLLNQTTTQ